jgi:hypothetical protein
MADGPAELLPKTHLQRGIRRRDFLVWSSAAIALPWVSRAASARELLADAGEPRLSLSVGYLEGSSQLPRLARLHSSLRAYTVGQVGNTFIEQRTVVPAVGLPSGDPSLVGVRTMIGVRGVFPTLADPASLPAAIDLDLYIPALALGTGDGALFHAWSYQKNSAASNLSAPLSFPVWPDWNSNFAVELTITSQSGVVTKRHATFTLAANKDEPRLQPGAYLLGLSEGVWNDKVELPDDNSPAALPLASVVLTVAPEGVEVGSV